MIIEDIFSKQLTRDINGVVKAEQIDNDSVYVELDEYVITQELDRHFRRFFETYIPAVSQRNPAVANKIGVWVSGFFGSGKSHFIKILAYLLENRSAEHAGQTRHALDFFKDKINDAMLFGDIHSAISKPADVILFNIDSRANTDDGENAILKVFLKVFNERVGYCADFPHIAHLERELDKRNQYQPFKDKFFELTGSNWLEQRDAYDFYRDELAESLAVATNQSSASTRQWVEQLESNLPLDIANFCKWVNDYLDRNGDRNILFMVDEVGQFIGKNTQMMLKLQTITEDLGAICGGRAWVIVTSQSDIDVAIGQFDKRDGEDFSKIQGRFYTRLQLSSSNTSEVIQKRLLEKTEAATLNLATVFAEKGDILRNQLSFDKTTTAALNGYSDAPSFIDNYPFVPYHYPLVQKVFESIRTKGATGKHLAMGERSLLDAFQSAAKQVKEQAIGVLIPFYCFYAPIESFLEPAVKRTIDQACELDTLTEFDSKILKTLFLIRYVDVLKSTLDNLVTLSIEQIDADKITLRKHIEESLNRLERQLLIARNGDEFIFLTNEEKEIENEIQHTDVEPSELTHKLSNLIFEGLLARQTVYRYPANKQNFKISRFCNGHPKDGTTLEDLVVKVISPLDSHYDSFIHDQPCLTFSLEGEGCVLVKLPDHPRIFGYKGLDGDLSRFIKTDRFLKQNSGQRPEQESLLREKQLENIEREKRLRHEFELLFADVDIYAIGAKLQPKSSTPSVMLEEAYQYIIENTFAKLNLLRLTPGEVLRELQSVLQADDMAQLSLDMSDVACNPEATREVELYITLKVERNEAVYLRDIIAKFTRRPYGWPNDEIVLLVARLALAGKISFTIGAAELSLKKAYDALTSVRKQGDIRLQKIRQHDEQQLKKATSVVRNVFNKTFTGSGEKELSEVIKQALTTWQAQLTSFSHKAQTGHYPGKADIELGLALVSGLLQQSNSFSLIERLVEDAKALEDFAENFEDLDDFYTTQFQTWQALSKALNDQFKANRPALEKDPIAKAALDQLEQIYKAPAPYEQLRHINPLISNVQQVNESLVLDKRKLAHEEIDQRLEHIQSELKQADATLELKNQALHPLQLCKKRIDNTDSIPQLNSEQLEAETYEEEAYEQINFYIEAQREKQQIKPPELPLNERAENKDKIPEQPVVIAPPKRTVTISPAHIATMNILAFIETEAQADQYLSRIREELLKAIKAGDRVRIK
ncbi:MAG: BREX system P-loop protein BrxC [Methylococcaceae bacterium]|nr:MAG: BREX system P-loop protein BrxC [Methylococcaceae bacterium]